MRDQRKRQVAVHLTPPDLSVDYIVKQLRFVIILVADYATLAEPAAWQPYL